MDLDNLIEQLKRGEASAGPLLVSLVAPQLLGYVRHLAPGLGDADQEAIVESAIERAVRRIDQYDPAKGTFRSWARGFVRHEYLNWRRNNPQGTVGELNDELTAAMPDEVDPEDRPPDPTSAALTALVLTESEASQLLLRLRYAERLSHEAIAERLGITPAACRKRLERLLKKLRDRASSDPDLRHLGGDDQ